MTINRYRYYNKWRFVKGNHIKDFGTCARCNNHKPYQLVYDANEAGLIGILTFKYNRIYAFKCPICPNFELIEDELAKAIIKGG